MNALPNLPVPTSNIIGDVSLPPNPLDALIAEQGVAQTATFDNLFGQGRDLWSDDAEFECFLHRLNAVRQEKD